MKNEAQGSVLCDYFFPSPHPNPNITNYLPTKKNSLKECSLQNQIKEGDTYDLI